jgi:L-aminopeptidase/D-esterase-like protein
VVGRGPTASEAPGGVGIGSVAVGNIAVAATVAAAALAGAAATATESELINYMQLAILFTCK